MLKKISVALLLTLAVLAFPVRLLDLTPVVEDSLKICKGIIFISLIAILMNKDQIFRKRLLAKPITGNILIRLLPVIVMTIAYIVYALIKNLNEIEVGTVHITISLLAAFIAASGEEVVMRGYVLNIFLKNNFSISKSILISSAIFSLLHLVNVFRYEDLWSIANQLIFSFTLGMLFGSLYAFTKNLLLVCFLHFLVNVPSVLTQLKPPTDAELAIANTTLTDNLLSILIMAVLMVPFLMLANYYIKIATRNQDDSNYKLADNLA